MTTPAAIDREALSVEEVALRLGIPAGWLDRWLAKHPRDNHDRPLYRVACRKKLITAAQVPLIVEALPPREHPSPPRFTIEAAKRLPVPPWFKEPERKSFIYFIQSGGFIKIGFSSNWGGRLRSLKTSNPNPIELLALIEGTREQERELHARFQTHRAEGEWFKPAPELLDHIGGLS